MTVFFFCFLFHFKKFELWPVAPLFNFQQKAPFIPQAFKGKLHFHIFMLLFSFFFFSFMCVCPFGLKTHQNTITIGTNRRCLRHACSIAQALPQQILLYINHAFVKKKTKEKNQYHHLRERRHTNLPLDLKKHYIQLSIRLLKITLSRFLFIPLIIKMSYIND